MGSPLGPVLANIFVGSQEERLNIDDRPDVLLYNRYVGDTFALEIEKDDEDLLTELNNLHPSLQFTCKKEEGSKLPFLDVHVQKALSTEGEDVCTVFETTIYRKPTFTGLYTRWDSFTAERYKTNLIRCLVNRAVRICSSNLLSMEIEKVKQIFCNNGYPLAIIDRVVESTLNKKVRPFGPQKCPVYLRLPWKGKRPADSVERAVAKAVHSAYPTCAVKVVYGSQPAFPSCVKDVLPTLQKSNVIYLFKCWCGSQYVGKTTQRLENRVQQHLQSIATP